MNTNNGATDPYGDDCTFYAENKEFCSDVFEEGNFNPAEMCCACGGGSSGGDGGDDDENDDDDVFPEPDEDDDDVMPEPDEDEEDDNGKCMDTNNGAVDPYGDGCDWYADNKEFCQDVYEEGNFNPAEMCCVCGGGSSGDDGDDDENDDDDVFPEPDEDDENDDDDVFPEPDEDEEEDNGQCMDIDNGAVDPYGDGCTFYAENKEFCEDVFEEGNFNPSEMCCACGGGSNGGDDEDEKDDDDVIPEPDEDDEQDDDDIIPDDDDIIPDDDEEEEKDGEMMILDVEALEEIRNSDADMVTIQVNLV